MRKQEIDPVRKGFRQLGLKDFSKIIPEAEMESIGKRYGGDKRKRDLPFKVHFWLLVYFIIEPTSRGLQGTINNAWCQIKELLAVKGESLPLRKSSLSKKNKTRPVKAFEKVFEYLVKRCQAARIPWKELEKFSAVRLVDSTLIDLALSLLAVFKTSRTDAPKKSQAKMQVDYELCGGFPRCIVLEAANSRNEKKVLKRLTKAKKSLFLIDLGYWCYETFDEIISGGHYFISRLKDNAVYRVVRKLGPHDYIIRLGGSKKMKHLVRLVGVRYGKEWYWYVTNLIDTKKFSGRKIAQIYRYRWQIEIFFLELKEILKVRRLHSRTVNGLKLELYAALCVYLLVKILMHQAAEKYNLKVEQISFRKSYARIAIWLRGIFIRQEIPNAEEIEHVLDDLVLYCQAERRTHKRRIVSICSQKKYRNIA